MGVENYIDIKYCQKVLSGVEITVVDEIDSTSECLKRSVKEIPTLPEEKIVLARKQIAGRGTRGRKWIDNGDGSLKFSFLIENKFSLCQIRLISPWIALNLCRALKSAGYKEIRIKWPNDLWVKEGKLSGVLTEVIRKDHSSYLIIGVGLNLFCDSNSTLPEDLKIGFLQQRELVKDEIVFRSEVFSLVAKTIKDVIKEVPDKFSEFHIKEWNQNDLLFNSEVRLIQDNVLLQIGTESGINSDGQLRIEHDGVVNVFNSGEVSVRTSWP